MSQPLNIPIYVIGLGCRRDTALTPLLDLVRYSLKHYDLPIEIISALATSCHKQQEPALVQLAQQLQLPLYGLTAEQLIPYEDQLSHRSALSQRITGSSGVAEASALALAEHLSGQRAQLLGPRHHNAQATCAWAVAFI